MLRGFDAPRDVWSVTVRPLAATRAPRSAEPAIGREGDVEAIRDLPCARRPDLRWSCWRVSPGSARPTWHAPPWG